MKRTTIRTSVIAAVVAVPLFWAGGASAASTPSPTSLVVTIPASPTATSASAAPASGAPVASNSPTSNSTNSGSALPSKAAAPTASRVSPSKAGAAAAPSASGSHDVGAHVARAVTASLGDPVRDEEHWGSAGGGWVQQFENGWAMVSDGGQVGRVTSTLLPYFTSHGFVNAVGWPVGGATTDAHGTYQKFDSPGHRIWGALATTPSGGVVSVKMGMYNNYFGGNLRNTLGAPLGEEFDSWKSGGGGHAQNFQNGWATYKWAKAMGWFPHEFTFAQLDLAKKGWPTSGTFAACGARKVLQEHGYTATGDRWCPGVSAGSGANAVGVSGQLLAYPTMSILRPAMPTSLSVSSPGDAGINVMLIQDKLGVRRNSFNEQLTLGSDTARRLKSAWGVTTVTPSLWAAKGMPAPWNVGTTPQAVSSNLSPASTRTARRAEMVRFIQAWTGLKYTYGSAGPLKAYGADCSGLVLAALQDAGVQTRTADVIDDIKSPAKLTKALYDDKGLDSIPFTGTGMLQPGDLIFYTRTGEAAGIHHVAMSLGGNMIFDTESHTYRAARRGIDAPKTGTDSIAPYVKRMPQ